MGFLLSPSIGFWTRGGSSVLPSPHQIRGGFEVITGKKKKRFGKCNRCGKTWDCKDVKDGKCPDCGDKVEDKDDNQVVIKGA